MLVAALAMGGMGLIASLLIGLGWWATTDRLVVEAGQRAERETALLREQLAAQVLPLHGSLRRLVAGALPQVEDEPSRLAQRQVLLEELRASPIMAAVYVGHADGDFLLARPLRVDTVRSRFQASPEARFLLQTVSRAPDGRRVGRFHFLDANGVLVQSHEEAGYVFDPRTRPWYTTAMGRPDEAHLSAPYRFATSQRTGMTLSRAAHGAAAVVGVDLAFDDLERLLVVKRMTPGARLALVHPDGQVLAATADLESIDRDRQPTLDAIGEPQLQQLRRSAPPSGHARMLDIDGRTWLGMREPFDIGLGADLELLELVPLDELSAASRQRALHVVGVAMLVALLLLPFGWAAGATLGRSLGRLRERAARIGRFDFGAGPLPPNRVREVAELSQALLHMGGTIEAFLRLAEGLATEPEVEHMLQNVLEQLVQATHSDGAAVYLWDAKTAHMKLMVQAGRPSAPPPESLAYPPPDGAGAAAAPPGGLQRRRHELEMRGRDGALQGLLQLEFADDAAHRDAAFLTFVRRLSGMLAVAIETRQLIEAQRRLFDAIIQLMADAIDAKSPYTGGHCERVPQLAVELLDRLHAESEGPYAQFRIGEQERYAFRLGAWLHDCGKVTSPEHIVDKATKLEVIRNRIHEVRLRFEILWRDAELARAQGELDAAGLAARQGQLQEDFAFVAQCNLGGEFMADAAIERLRAVGAQRWLRHFDDRLGLSAAELRQLETARPEAPPLPAAETLLADRPEHRVPWGDERPPVQAGDPRNRYGFTMTLPAHRQNQGELHNLSIRRGTLSDEDRFRINDHIVQTYVMLKGLPWPVGLEQVPELAATHHERLDGRGYPRSLPAERLGLPDRVMALADVFEALTAADRPYKPPKTLSETLRIMAFMCKDGHLDAELFRYFVRGRLWEGYATRFMKPAQRDAVDEEALLRVLAPG